MEAVGVRLEPERQDFFEHAEFVEHFQRRRMNGGGALILDRRRLNLEHRDGNAAPVERERTHHANRPSTDHDNARVAFFGRHHPKR